MKCIIGISLAMMLNFFWVQKIESQQICGTYLTLDSYDEYVAYVEKYQNEAPQASSKTCIPIHPIIIRDDNGIHQAVENKLINKVIANYNYHLEDVGLSFYFIEPSFVDDSDYFDLTQLSGSFNEFNYIYDNHYDPKAINIIFIETNNGVPGTGYSPIPSHWTTKGASMLKITKSQAAQVDDNFDLSVNNIALHELGHFLGLHHPTLGTSNGNTCNIAELVARPGGINPTNCFSAGDFICDTPADPGFLYNQYCIPATNSFSGDSTDINGQNYMPFLGNIMHDFGAVRCRNILTLGQKSRMYHGYLERINNLGFDYSAPAENVNTPTDLKLTETNVGVQLNWKDNADNEFGYLIERSNTINQDSFKAIPNGGVNKNTVFFLDKNTTANTTYYYRVKASNSTCNSYSQLDSITTSLQYCQAQSTVGSCNNYRIEEVRMYDPFSNLDFVNYSYDGICDGSRDFELSINCLDQDLFYNLKVDLFLDSINLFGFNRIKMWGDWNSNGVFEESAERILISNLYDRDENQIIISSIKLPALDEGVKYNLRLRAAFVNDASGLPPNNDFDPCEYYEYSSSLDFSIYKAGPNCDPLSIESQNSDNGYSINVYPNPFKGATNFEVFNVQNQDFELEIFDALGKTIMKRKGNFNSQTKRIEVSLQDKAAGSYIYKFTTNNKTKSGIIIKV